MNKTCDCPACRRSRQYEALVAEGDVKKLAWALRGLMNYVLELEHALGRKNWDKERWSA